MEIPWAVMCCQKPEKARKLNSFKHDRPTNPERDLELQGIETLQSSSIGRWAVAMSKISMVMILCQGLC